MHRVSHVIAARPASAKTDATKGFTLIELLIVVIIIGILAAIAVPMFLSQREAAWKASVESDVKNTALFIEVWAVDHKGLVTGAQTGVIPISTGTNTVSIAVVGQDYTICGSNPDLNQKILYDSAAGGLDGSTFIAGAC